MDLGPETDVYPCETCGVDGGRSLMISACIAFYSPTYVCPVCWAKFEGLRGASRHMFEHNPEPAQLVRQWLENHEPQYEVRRKDP